MTTSLLFGHLLLEQITLSHSVAFPLRNIPNVKSISMQNKSARLFTKKTKIDVENDGSLRDNYLCSGSGVSLDHF